MTIALALARELGNVVVTDSARFGYTQGERMTRLLHAAQSAYFADFVLFLDADEFIGTTSRTALLAELDKIPAGGFGAIAWRTYVITGGIAIADPPRDLEHRLVIEALPVFKTVLRLDGAFQPGPRRRPGQPCRHLSRHPAGRRLAAGPAAVALSDSRSGATDGEGAGRVARLPGGQPARGRDG